MSIRTPRDIANLLHETFGGSDSSKFWDLFAPDGVYELPFAPPGMPARLEGKPAIKEGMATHAANARRMLDIQGAEMTIHELADPEVVVVEFEAYGTAVQTGDKFRFPSSIGVIRVRDGNIVSYRDYPNVIGGAAAAGTLPQLAAALTA